MRPMRPPATGPSNGRGESMTAAEAPVRASTSDSFSWSAEMTLASTCTSSFKPLGNRGRMGRSMRRETRVSRSEGRPISRRKKLPGIRPAAYIFSEYSTVRGKKPLSNSRAWEQTVTSTTVPPHCTQTAPWAWLARRPVSKMISLPPTVAVTRVGLKISWFMWTSYEGDSGKSGQQRPAVRPWATGAARSSRTPLPAKCCREARLQKGGAWPPLSNHRNYLRRPSLAISAR